MAQIRIEGDEICLQLSGLESLGALHSSPRAKVSELSSITEVKDPWQRSVMRGMRAPGTGIPYVIMLGTLRYRGGKDFCAIYKRRPVYILNFSAGEFRRWIVTADFELPESVQAKIGN